MTAFMSVPRGNVCSEPTLPARKPNRQLLEMCNRRANAGIGDQTSCLAAILADISGMEADVLTVVFPKNCGRSEKLGNCSHGKGCESTTSERSSLTYLFALLWALNSLQNRTSAHNDDTFHQNGERPISILPRFGGRPSALGPADGGAISRSSTGDCSKYSGFSCASAQTVTRP